jgi:hypothetical protein
MTTRSEFFKRTFLGLAGLAIGPTLLQGLETSKDVADKSKRLKAIWYPKAVSRKMKG